MSGVEWEANNTAAVLGAIRGGTKAAVQATTITVWEVAAKRAPRDTSDLANSIQPDLSELDSDVRGAVDVGVEYGLPVEEGSTHMFTHAGEVHIAAQPYIAPAVAEARERLPEETAIAINVRLVAAT